VNGAYYDKLSGLDSSFLVLETPACPMHIAAALTLDAAPLARRGGGVDFDRICEAIGARLHHLPRYRQRLAYTPIERRPIWVDDPHFNLHYHLRHTALPKPGDERQLKRLCGRILSQQLDRDKPLWEMWVVEGLSRRRMAVVLKVHHCMADGLGGVELLGLLLSATPEVQDEEAPPWTPRPAPGPLRLMGEGLLDRARLPLGLVRAAGRVLRAPLAALAGPVQQMQAAWQMLRLAMHPASATPLNRPIGPHRRFDWLSMDLGAVRQAKARLGGTVNDVVLAVASGGLRRFFQARHAEVDGLQCRVFAPVGMRAEDDHGAFGNRVSFWLIDLPVCEPDPLKRLRRIREQTSALKRRQVLHDEVIAGLAEWMGPRLLSAGAEAVMRLRPFNLVVTNIRGPQFPLYLLGARALAVYPLVPLYASLALGIALFSYEGKLCWGLNSDWDQAPDLHELVLALEASLDELRALEPENAAPAAGGTLSSGDRSEERQLHDQQSAKAARRSGDRKERKRR
jgi:WS/DGAT/MGAT family acyltransferase